MNRRPGMYESVNQPRYAAAWLRIGAALAALAVSSCASDPGATESGDLGAVSFAVSCGADVQARFDRAVALLHHMTYPQARRLFREVAAASPECGMAYWGIAMTLFTPLWPTRPGPEELEAGRAAVTRARELDPPTARERRFIEMAGAFFDPVAGAYWSRIRAWEAAARRLYEAHPSDHDAAAFYALAHLATAPPAGGTAHHDRAAAILARILEEEPRHPGAIHYTIHANDIAGRERESPDVVRRYLEIAPRNPHALHMPTHIFVRLGEWEDVIEWNRRAAEAALEHPAGERGQWVWDEFPHATEYLVYAYLQRGDDDAARDAMARLENTPDLQPGFKTAFHLSSIPARFALERRAWSEAADLRVRPDPSLAWDRFPWPQAVTGFARGLGAVRSGDLSAGAAAEARLATLRQAARGAGEDLFAHQIEVLRLGLAAWLAHADGNDDEAVRLLRAASTLEAETPKHAVTPAPTLPAAEQLGDLLMELRRPTDALEAYRASLRAAPGRFNSLAGAARAARAAGDTAAAASYDERLRAQTVPDSPRRAVREGFSAVNGVGRPG